MMLAVSLKVAQFWLAKYKNCTKTGWPHPGGDHGIIAGVGGGFLTATAWRCSAASGSARSNTSGGGAFGAGLSKGLSTTATSTLMNGPPVGGRQDLRNSASRLWLPLPVEYPFFSIKAFCRKRAALGRF